MVFFATLTASLVTTSGRSAWFVGVLGVMVYLMFATAIISVAACRKQVNESPVNSVLNQWKSMKTKEIIKRAHELAKPFRISKGKDFRLKDVDPDDTLDFTKEEDKPRAKEALAMGVMAFG